jgi:choline dehydrogenase-like flavoprotein
MGADPRLSVVDRDLRVHGTPNLYVLGSSVFVTGGAVPPTLTIAALAFRLAEHLARAVPELPLSPGAAAAQRGAPSRSATR